LGRGFSFATMPGESPMTATDQLAVDTLRTLSIDAVQKANSGHPGAPMGLAPVAYSLWQEALRYDPAAPQWPGRDRFVLSGGHASALLYSLLHLAGVIETDAAGRPTGKPAIAMEDLQSFRQLHSKTPGHPEYGHTTGVETTTGPLGQGIANSVGMAIASRFFAARYSAHLGYRVWAMCGDGDVMEGVAYEAASIAGHLRLANLCWVYDSNRITIEGRTDLAFSEDVAARFEAMGWAVLRVTQPNDLGALSQAWHAVYAETSKPTLVIVETKIGFGSPKKEDTNHAHGEPLGVDEVAATKVRYGWDPALSFHVPAGVRELFATKLGARGARLRRDWEQQHAQWSAAHPEQAREVEMAWRGGCQGHGDARCRWQGVGGVGQACAVAGRWFSRFDTVDEDALEHGGRGRFVGNDAGWSQCALRHSRARDGIVVERHGAGWVARVWRDLLGVL
jgi:transketolase